MPAGAETDAMGAESTETARPASAGPEADASKPEAGTAGPDSPDRIYVETRIAVLDLPPEGFRLVSGRTLKRLEVAYETYGTLDADRKNAVLICSPLTTDAHAAGWHSPSDRKPGWWDDMIGPGKAIDTNRYYVIASNMLGGCRGTTGPCSVDPETGRPYGSTFPRITVEDMVAVQRLLVETLGIDVLEAVIGGSMGGMQALQWTVSFPGKVRKCICIAAAACLSAQALGFEIIGRKVIVNDPDFRGGDYYGAGEAPERGLAYARMIGHLTYLSALSMHQKFGRNQRTGAAAVSAAHDENRFETGFEVESYLAYQGEAFVKRFDANSYLHITWAMDHFDLFARYGSLQNAFAPSGAEFLLVALSSDWLFFPEQTRELGSVLLGLKKVVSVVELDSPYGHDAFLLEVAHLSRVIQGFLEKPAFAANGTVHPGAPGNGAARTAVQRGGTAGGKASSPAAGGARPRSAAGDLEAIGGLIEEGSHILDIGCGDGALIDSLYRTHGVTGIGIDIDLDHVVECLRKNVPVLQSDADKGLSLIGGRLFDYAVLNRTLQEVKRPQLVLNEMLRVARKGIVAFPNFAHIGNRLFLLRRGVMPVSEALPHHWHDTPNIHLFSLDDFRILCRREGIRIEEIRYTGTALLSSLLLAAGRPNLGAEFVIARISRAS
jgi:homoserine O-acetyltransferase